MEIVRYKKNDPWIGQVQCPKCKTLVLFWSSSGMSECFPHFYCDSCSNVIFRSYDQQKVYCGENKEAILKEIEMSLPMCECGGMFKVGANSKCPSCKYEFINKNNPETRLTDPHIILVDGASFYDENGPVYSVRIK